MNPVLKKISPEYSRENVVLVIRKHVGAEPSNLLCKQAYEACLARCSGEIASNLKDLFTVLDALESELLSYDERCFRVIDSYIGTID